MEAEPLHPPSPGTGDLRQEARGPQPPAGPGRGWAGGGRSAALRCAGRRERGGEDSSGSGGLKDGGRTCGLGGRLNLTEEGERGPPLPRSEETFGGRGSGRRHLLQQWTRRRRRSRRAHRPQQPPCAQVGNPAALCPFLGRHGPDALPSRPLSSGTRAGQVRGPEEGARPLRVHACARALC